MFMCMFCDFMEVELDSKKMENWAFTRGVVIFSTKRDANSEILLNYVTPHLTGDSTFFVLEILKDKKIGKISCKTFCGHLFSDHFLKNTKKVFFFCFAGNWTKWQFLDTQAWGTFFFLCFFKSFISYNTFLNKQSHLELSN